MLKKLLILIAASVLSTAVANAQQTTVVPAVTTPVDPVVAAWQPFTGGVMIWWSDTRQIWVFTNTGNTIQVMPDTYTEGMPSPQLTAPEGYFTPVRGFGMAWLLLGGPNSALGWAMSPEIGYDTAARRATGGAEIVVQGPGNTQYGVTIPAGAAAGTWRVIAIA